MVTVETVRTLVLDLEGTLVSNAVSQFPRPGLRRFLDGCHARFRRIVVYTGVHEVRFREVASVLVKGGHAPAWFGEVEHVHWVAGFKDLRTIPGVDPAAAAIVDDLEEAIHPEQRGRWIRVAPFEAPYPEEDAELERLSRLLRLP